jgi:hypothetical protein
MVCPERRAEETRIRRALGLSSFTLASLERYLLQKGHIPDTADEQAARDAAFKLYHTAWDDVQCGAPIWQLFETDDMADDILESASVKYDAVVDLIHMVATWKAKATTARHEREGNGPGTAVKLEEA